MISINESLTDDMLEEAKLWVKETIDNYNKTLIDLPNSDSDSISNSKSKYQNSEFVSEPSFDIIKYTSNKRNEESKILPDYISYYKRKRGNIVSRHGYYVYYSAARVSKYVMTSIDQPLTNDMLKEAKRYLKEIINNYNAKLLEEKMKKITIKKEIQK